MQIVPNAGQDTERKIVTILKILSESSEPLGSINIARELEREGIFLSERAVRYHLRIADERGYTKSLGRDGRVITPEGLAEIKEALAAEHLGFIREKLEMLAFLAKAFIKHFQENEILILIRFLKLLWRLV